MRFYIFKHSAVPLGALPEHLHTWFNEMFSFLIPCKPVSPKQKRPSTHGGASQSESFCAFCSKALLKVISNHSESGTESVERCKQRWAKQMGQVIEILRGKGSQELITLCMIPLQSHYSYLQMSWKQQHRSSRVGGHSRGLPVLWMPLRTYHLLSTFHCSSETLSTYYYILNEQSIL